MSDDIAFLPARHLTTDQANADRLYKATGKNLMYSAARGGWLYWTGTHWSPDAAAAYRQMCGLSALVLAEAEDWANRKTDIAEEADKNREIAEALRKWAPRCEMRHTLDAAFALLRQLVEVPASTLDADPNLLNVANGTVDLRTGKLQPHDPRDRITRIIPVAYHPGAKAPMFEDALAKIAGDTAIANFLKRLIGYCATGLTSEQSFAVWHGSGANGKSLLLGTFERVLGPYAGVAAPGLLVGRGTNDRHPTEIAALFGKRMVTAHESSDDGVLHEEFVKRATGSDSITARYMRQDFFEFTPTHKLQLVTNHKPQIRGNDHAIWRRVLLIPFTVRFGTPEEVAAGLAHYVRNPHLADALHAEDEGILAWIVAGAVAWHMLGLNPPEAVLAAGKTYREEQDRVGQFLREHCEQRAGATVPLKRLHGAYQAWANECRYFALGRNRFKDAVAERPGISAQEGVHYKDEFGKECKGVVFTGVGLLGRQWA